MFVTNVARRSVRIIALPLTTASRTPENSSSGHLTYYHFVTPPPKEDGKTGTNWSKWATSKATHVWAGFGKAPEGTWKRKTFVYGERLVDRIDFEELALKSLDPNLGPKLTRLGGSETKVKPENHPAIRLIYPASVCTAPLVHLRSLLDKRTPRHKRGFYMWMFLAPLTAPFMVIPVIPNLPFFFCVWRSWSHWKAYKASDYLSKVLSRNAIVPEANSELDSVYKQYAPPELLAEPCSEPAHKHTEDADSDASSSPDLHTSPESPRKLLLTKDAVPTIVKLFELGPDSSFSADVYRALEQARLRIDPEKKS